MQELVILLMSTGILCIIISIISLYYFYQLNTKTLIYTGVILTAVYIGCIGMGYWLGNFIQEALQTAVIKGGG